METFEGDETGRSMIGSGYICSGYPVGTAAAIACLTETEGPDMPVNAKAPGVELFAGLPSLAGKHDIIGDVRGGHELMRALKLVSDWATEATISQETVARIP